MIFMPKQRVLFEASPMLDNQKTGVGYYVGHLMESLHSLSSDRFALTGYYFNFLNRHGSKTPAESNLRFYKIWLMPGKVLSICRRLGFQPFLEFFVHQKSDTVLFTNYVALPQLHKRKVVLAVYDLGFLDVPEFTQNHNLAYLKRFCPPSIRRADTIITISDFTKARIEHYFPDIKANIIVTPIPPASVAVTNPKLSDDLLSKGVKPKGYILYVGTIEPRKNLQALIAAYTLLNAPIRSNYSLVLAGGKGWKDAGILASVAEQQAGGMDIILTGYVSDADKGALYANAACFVLPSHYEGFGMPILEAMQYGLPTLVSDIPVFHEVAGDAALYFDKDDPQSIADSLVSVLSDDSVRNKLVSSFAKQVGRFSWEDNAKKVIKEL